MVSNLLKSLPFRLVLAFTALYVVCFSVGAYMYVMDLQKRMQQSMDQTIVQKHSQISALYENEGVEAVENMMAMNNDDPFKTRYGYHISTLSGESISANMPARTNETGFEYVSTDVEVGETLRFYTHTHDDYILSLGRSIPDASGITGKLLLYCLPNLIWPVLLALLGGVFLAHRSHLRVQSIVNSMDRVAKGDLDARLPISKHADAIDDLSTNMNGTLDLLAQQIHGMKQVGCNMAHDLKTPLNRLYGKIEKAADNVDNVDQVQINLDDALEEADQLNGMIESLLRISQIEAGARKSQFVDTNLLSTVESACEIYEAVADDKNQTITLNVNNSVDGPDGFSLPGDKNLLLQMTVNVLENAIGHCPEGAKIDVNAAAHGDEITLSICDNGAGIPADERDRVFDRLYRLEKSRTTKGAGVGLSFVKAIVELHGGRVSLRDNMPGLCVDITFTKKAI